MTTLHITRGLPGSGKTYWAGQWTAEDTCGRVRVNRDDLRSMLDDGRWIKGVTEGRLLAARDAAVLALLRRGINVVCDDTNLPSYSVRGLAKLAQQAGAAFEVHDFTDTPLETCIARDASRDRTVGEDVIRDLHTRFIRGKGYPLPMPEQATTGIPERYEPKPGAIKAVLVDIDGTVALMGDRSPYDEACVDRDQPNTVFVNSMSDLFHAKVPRDFIRRVFDVMADTPQHTYQILTKRSLRLRRIAPELAWPENVWMGVSVEDREPESLIRIDHLSDTPAKVKFLSCEPLVADLGTIELASIDWVICGGESGAGCRPMEEEWARSLLRQCKDAHGPVPFFMKQMGSVWARDWFTGGQSVAAHGDPKGGDPQHWPADLRVREFPQPAEVPA